MMFDMRELLASRLAFVFVFSLSSILDKFSINKIPIRDSIESQRSIEPSWLDQAADILYIKGIIVLELKNTFCTEKSEIIKAYSSSKKHIIIKKEPAI